LWQGGTLQGFHSGKAVTSLRSRKGKGISLGYAAMSQFAYSGCPTQTYSIFSNKLSVSALKIWSILVNIIPEICRIDAASTCR
jgi:hypothetical protein